MLIDQHLAIRLEGIGHGQRSLHLRHIKLSHHIVVAHLTVLQLHLRVLPYCEALLQTGTVVIVRRRAPELWRHRLTVYKHRLAIDIKIVYHTTPLADGERRSSSIQLHIALRLLLFK